MRVLLQGVKTAAILGLATSLLAAQPTIAEDQVAMSPTALDRDKAAAGKRMYREGLLPSGELMTGIYAGDVRITGEQVICGKCHRRSGLGASEGQEVVPAVTGDILYKPLRTPTSKLPLAPELRPAYTDASLKRAIRQGIGADGEALSVLMPRYALSDEDLDALISYLKALTTAPDPGVGDEEIHLATVVADSLEPERRQAVVDVFNAFVDQKNAGTRNEAQRAAHAPWHKEWTFRPYRRWVLHVWNLQGPPASWAKQLDALYREQPVFALVGGVVSDSWQPVHDFCETNRVPCLFPDTDLPVVGEDDFYTVYFDEGMALEANAIAQHVSERGPAAGPVVQIYREDDPRSRGAAVQLRHRIEARGGPLTDRPVAAGSALTAELWASIVDANPGATAVLWLNASDCAELWQTTARERLGAIYLSSTLRGTDPGNIPSDAWARVYLVHPYELPARLPRLLARSTGWLKAKGIYAPHAEREQANAFFALRMAAGALQGMRGFFLRDYLLERIEHMVDNATYTSVYPRMSLAPGQRFVSRGVFLAQFRLEDEGALAAVTDWYVPGHEGVELHR
jgi:ABC-type branched-subunit amino acid transport system substrate-binding protein/mono/diheme cytochrome c family protein